MKAFSCTIVTVILPGPLAACGNEIHRMLQLLAAIPVTSLLHLALHKNDALPLLRLGLMMQ